MLGKTNASSGKINSVIAVTYPEGSACTCTNGTKTYKAKDTSGNALFNVAPGEWTVSSSNGEKSRSEIVSITEAGQCETVHLVYTLTLFDSGIVTSGWAGSGVTDGYFTASTYLGMGKKMTDTVSNIYIYTQDKIDVSEYSTLYATVDSLASPNAWKFGLTSSLGSSPSPYVTMSAGKTVSVDISSVTGERYVEALTPGPSSSYQYVQLYITKVWLE